MEHWFDSLTRSMGAQPSRRAMLRVFGAGMTGLVLQSLAPGRLWAGASTPCDPGQDRCAGVCTDLQTDASNCGTCGTRVAKCVGGQNVPLPVPEFRPPNPILRNFYVIPPGTALPQQQQPVYQQPTIELPQGQPAPA